MKKTLSTLAILLVAPALAFAQLLTDEVQIRPPAAFCGHELMMTHQNVEALHSLETAYVKAMHNHTSKRVKMDQTLPVVIHIVHDNGVENIPDERVIQCIKNVNEAFANTGYYDSSLGVSTPFQFCLAHEDPDGNATSGINRVESVYTEMTSETEDLTLKNLIRWNPNRYINIWLVREICSNASGCGVAGYATFPDSHGTDKDGIVMEARWVGENEAHSAVLVHELGHYLGLRHTFEGGCPNLDCLEDGDRVCDTPPDQTTAYIPCDGEINSCMTDVNPFDSNNPFSTDQNDHFRNYMDYSDLECYAEFTDGQSSRMAFFLNEVRSSLLGPSLCEEPCSNPIVSLFEPSSTEVFIGETVSFSNLSQQATDFEWLINGVAISNAEEIDQLFSEEGRFEVTLVASNADPHCLARAYTQVIDVRCPVFGDIMTNTTFVLSGEPVNFSSTVINAETSTWYVNGVAAGSGDGFSYTFDEEGFYEIYLIGANDLCSYQSNSLLIQVDNPCVQANSSLGATEYEGLREFRSLNVQDDGTSVITGYDLVLKKSSDFEDVWIRRFNTNVELRLDKSEFLTNDGGILVKGAYWSPDLHFYPSIFKLDADGNIEWDLFLNVASSSGRFNVKETNNGNLIVVGTKIGINTSYHTRGFCMMLSPEGEVLWEKTYEPEPETPAQLTNVIPLPDGTFILTGIFGFFEPGTNYRHRVMVLKIDADGDVLWAKKYISSDMHHVVLASTELVVNEDGSFIIASTESDDETQSERFLSLLKIDQDGNFLNSRLEADDVPGNTQLRIAKSHDGNALISGGTIYNGIVKIDQDLNILWTRHYNNIGSCTDVKSLPDNTIVVTGRKFVQNIEYNGVFNRVDQNGFSPACSFEVGSSTRIPTGLTVDDITVVTVEEPIGLRDVDYTYEVVEVEPSRICFLEESVLDNELHFIGATSCLIGTEYQVEICNNGTVPSNALTPITFYNANPTEQAAEAIDVFTLGEALAAGECRTLTLSSETVVTADKIYAIVNDNASMEPVFSLLDFPVTAYEECSFLNNLDFTDNNYTVDTDLLDLGSDQMLCQGDSILFDAGAADTFEWSTGANEPQITVTEPGVYWVTKTDSCTIQRDTVEVLDYSFMPLELGPDLTTCDRGIHVLDAGPDYATYLWNDFYPGQTFTAYEGGTYWVEATDVCGIVQYDTIHISIDSSSIFDLGPDTTICIGESLNFSVDGFLSYDWYPETGVNCPTCGQVEITPSTSTTYSLVATSPHGCLSVDTVRVEVSVVGDCEPADTIPAGQEYIFNVFPNPSDGRFTVEIVWPEQEPGKLRVFNTLGQIIAQQVVPTPVFKTDFNLENAPAAMYWVQLLGTDIKTSKKVLVIH